MTVVSFGPVPDVPGDGRERLARTRAVAERCLEAAAAQAGVEVEVVRDAGGLPRAKGPVEISFSGTRGLAAAALSRHPVGVDVEWLGRRRLRPVRESAERRELSLVGDDDASLILLWTAKEALLKRLGIGLAGLSRCRLLDLEASPDGTQRLSLAFDVELYRIVSRRIGGADGHWVSVATADDAVHFLPLAAEALT